MGKKSSSSTTTDDSHDKKDRKRMKKDKKKKRMMKAKADGEDSSSWTVVNSSAESAPPPPPPHVSSDVDNTYDARKKKKTRKRGTSDADALDCSGGLNEDGANDDNDDGNNVSDQKKRKKKKKKDKKRKEKNRGDGDVDDIEGGGECKKGGTQSEEGCGVGTEQEDATCSTPSKIAAGGEEDEKIVASSHLDFRSGGDDDAKKETATTSAAGSDGGPMKDGVTLLLFYQYVEPPWTPGRYQDALQYVRSSGVQCGLTGRMRVAREGLNCTLTGSYDDIRMWCRKLRGYCPDHFSNTEFKLTDNLPETQRFPKLNAFPVEELVHYGLAGNKAPPISKSGTHLEPEEYHKKMTEDDTVIIDVRNHYESSIGRFDPPTTGARLVDPKMRKSTEFPVWLDKPETREVLRGKQVLMYCTGGVRCERASALLKQKLSTEDDMKDLDIKGVYQLQGGIDKYFKAFPEGGWWKGKNFTFDKRLAHAPPKLEGTGTVLPPLGRCDSCGDPWDFFGAKRRCPTCGVPSLFCRKCHLEEKEAKSEGKNAIRKNSDPLKGRCQLCIEENIVSKAQIRTREQKEMEEYEAKLKEKRKDDVVGRAASTRPTRDNWEQKNPSSWEVEAEEVHETDRYEPRPNPEGITRLYVGNLCTKRMDEYKLSEVLPGVTHVLWLTDRQTGKFYGSCFVEMATPDDASVAVGKDGMVVLGRPMKVRFQKPNGKDLWPPPSAVRISDLE